MRPEDHLFNSIITLTKLVEKLTISLADKEQQIKALNFEIVELQEYIKERDL